MKTIVFVVTEEYTPELEALLKASVATLQKHFSLVFITTHEKLSIEFADSNTTVLIADQNALNIVLSQQKGEEAIQTFSLATHEIVVNICKARAHTPFFINTHYQSLPVAKNRTNKRIFNALTDINLFITQKDQAATGNDRTLALKNPVLLEQTAGSLNWDLYLHTYKALLEPNRTAAPDLIKQDYSDIRLSYITHFYCNQNDISSITDLLRKYEQYDKELLARVQFVIVDDGSPVEYTIPDFDLNLVWLKIDQDIRWNQAGARNLGVTYAKSDTIMVSDLDHELPEASMKQLVNRKPCGRHLYKIWRTHPDGQIYKGHANLFVLSRGRFFELHGYDEEFSGGYGAEDFRFVKYHKAMGTIQRYLPKSITVCERTDINREKSYHSLKRDLSFNTGIDSRKRKELLELGNGYGHSRMFLNFTWHIAKASKMDIELKRPIDKSWKRRWLLRQIFPSL